MKEDQYRSQFRLPYSLYEKLKVAADKNGGSLNGELVARLERSIEADALGLNKDLLDVIALQSTLTATFCRALDWSRLDEHETEVLRMLQDVAERIVSKIHFDKSGNRLVSTDE